jgi:dephospho-CoA kinase
VKIIVIIGLPGSGKSVASKLIARKGIPVYKPGSVIKEEVAKRGLELTVESEEHVSRQLRKEHGMDAPARFLGEKIEKDKSEIICMDGFRNIEEVEYMERFGEIFLVEVRAPKEVRHGRLIERANSRDPCDSKAAEWRDGMEIERGLGKLLETEKYKKFVINNNGNLQNLEKRLEETLERIKQNPFTDKGSDR